MKNIRLEITASMAIDRVNELRDSGYKQGIDFDFSYHPSIQTRFNGPTQSAYVLFTFYNEKLATFFTLKWL
jgi:hypothetical protein